MHDTGGRFVGGSGLLKADELSARHVPLVHWSASSPLLFPSSSSMSIHVAITRRVRPGREPEFEERLRKFVQASLDNPGTRGVQMLHPAPDAEVREYGILRSFATEADKDAFYQSPAYLQWVKDVGHLVEGEHTQRELHGLEAWFRQPDGGHPPRWKMGVATLAGVYPTSLLLGTFLGPHLHGLPRPVATLVVAVAMVLCLTWVVMPLVTKVLQHWLHSEPKK